MLSYTVPRITVQQVLQKHPLPFNKNVHVAKVLQRIQTVVHRRSAITCTGVRKMIAGILNTSITAAETGIALTAVQ